MRPSRECSTSGQGLRRISGWVVLLLLGLALTRAEGQDGLPTLPTPGPNAGLTLDERLRKLEEVNERILRENAELRDQVRDLQGRVSGPSASGAAMGAGANAGGGAGEPAGLDAGPNIEPQLDEGGAAGGLDETSRVRRRPNRLYGNFDKGFLFETEDEEYLMKFSNETQVEARIFEQGGQRDTHSGLYIPRQIWAFSGRVTKPIEYSVSINKGLGNINLRDAYLNFHYDDRLMFRFGRYRVPYTYEFYATSNVDLIAPERSLFAINYGLNREIGLMGWGEVFDGRLDYAVGVFNGPRNGFHDLNDPKDVIAYLSGRPFEKWEGSPLRFLNLGGSAAFGNENNPVNPTTLKTAVNAGNEQGDAASSPQFLMFNPTVVEQGNRELWNLHAAYFYKGLSLLAEWDSGYTTYGRLDNGSRTPVPVSGYYVQGAYILTGETVEKRVVIDPIHPFDIRRGKFGLGAWEVHGRFSQLNVGQEVFTAGLSDPNLWSNNAWAVDTGFNWYINRYFKVYLDWQHAEFGNPVFINVGRWQKTSDLFWLRCQFYF